MRFRVLIGRSLRLRCPRCGQGRLFRRLWSMHSACDHCGYVYARGDGYFLGSIYVNYGLTTFLVLSGYAGLFFGLGWRGAWVTGPLLVFCVVFPLCFFRYARSLWVGFDQYFDPIGREREEGVSPAVGERVKSSSSPEA